MVDEHLQAAYDEFHQASVELGKQLEQAPHSQQAEVLRKRVKSLRANLMAKCHSHLVSPDGRDGLKR